MASFLLQMYHIFPHIRQPPTSQSAIFWNISTQTVFNMCYYKAILPFFRSWKRKTFLPFIAANTVSLEHYHYTKPQRKCSILKLTRRTAMVPLQHHRTPPENSDGMLFLLRTCLKSDNFSSFINAVWWPATCNSRKWKLHLLLNTHTHTHTHTHVLQNSNSDSWLFPKWKPFTMLCYNNSEQYASCSK